MGSAYTQCSTDLYSMKLTTVQATARQLTLSDLTYAPLTHTCDTRARWINWLYMESRRRLGVVFRVINLIVYFDPGAMCSLQSDLLVAPLPTKKVLWEARDEFTWYIPVPSILIV